MRRSAPVAHHHPAANVTETCRAATADLTSLCHVSLPRFGTLSTEIQHPLYHKKKELIPIDFRKMLKSIWVFVCGIFCLCVAL